MATARTGARPKAREGHDTSAGLDILDGTDEQDTGAGRAGSDATGGDTGRVPGTSATGRPRTPRRAIGRRILAGAIVGAILFGAAGLVAGLVRPVTYSASAVVKVVDVPGLVRDANQVSGPDGRTAAVKEAQAWLGGAELQRRLAQRVGGTVPRLGLEQVGDSQLLRVTAATGDRDRSVVVVRNATALYVTHAKAAAARQLRDRRATIEDQLKQQKFQLSVSTGQNLKDARAQYKRLIALRAATVLATGLAAQGPTVVQAPAADPSYGVGPSWLRWAGIGLAGGALLGAIAGLLLALARRYRAATVRRPSDAVGLGVPVLLPSLPRASTDWASRLLASRADRRSAGAAGLVANRILGEDVRSVAVTAPAAGSGATRVAVQLAAAAAQDGPTLLVCADDLAAGWDHTAGELLGIRHPVGIAQLLTGSTITASHLELLGQSTELENLWVLAAGTSDHGPADLMAASAHGLLDAAKATDMTVIVDAPALAQSRTTIGLCQAADATLLVLGRGVTTPAEAVSAVETLRENGASVAGAVLCGRLRHRRRAKGAGPSGPRTAEGVTRQRTTTAQPADASRTSTRWRSV